MATAQVSRPSFRDSLNPSEWEALLALGRPRRWARGEMLMRAGQRADSALVVLSGLAKVHKLSSDGSEVVLGLSGPGDLLGEVSAVRDATRSADVTALEPMEGAVITVAALRGFISENPRAALALLELALARLHEGNARRLEFATSESLARVASRLVELAERFGVVRQDGMIDVGLPITQEELASWSASSRESTARALR